MIRIDAGHARAGRAQIVVDGIGEKCADLVAEREIGVALVQIHSRVPICRLSAARVSARKPAVLRAYPASGTWRARRRNATACGKRRRTWSRRRLACRWLLTYGSKISREHTFEP